MQYVNIKFPENLQIFFDFYGFKDLPLPTLITTFFTKLNINIAEADAPFAFKKHGKSTFFLYNIEKTLFLLFIIFIIKAFVMFIVNHKKADV